MATRSSSGFHAPEHSLFANGGTDASDAGTVATDGLVLDPGAQTAGVTPGASGLDADVGSLATGAGTGFTMTIGDAASNAFSLTSANLAAAGLNAADADWGKLQNGLSEVYMESQLDVAGLTGAARTAALDGFHSVNTAADIYNGMVAIDAVATNGDGAALLTQLEGLGLQSGASYGSMAGGFIPLDALDSVSHASLLAFARPVYAVTEAGPGAGSVVSQDVQAMHADTVQAGGLTGAGITIGILSDSFNTSASADKYANDVTSGDLPAGINILEDHPNGTDEGRGMAQIAYDVAPGANFDFYTADTSMADFAHGIVTLSERGDKVIADDVRYFSEPMFQDGILAQAEDTAYSNGSMVFSSAGNYDQRAYDSAFRDSGQTFTDPNNGVTYELHDFDPGAGISTSQSVTQAGNVDYILQWDQPFFSLGGAGATSDLALLFFSGATFLGEADSTHVGGDPIEIAGFNGNGTLSVEIGVKQGTPLPGEIKYAMIGGDSIVNTFATDSATMYGHANAQHAIAVGAAGYDDTPAFGQTPPLGEWFTSKGGQNILFDDHGNRLGTPEVRPGVAFTAADGGNTTFFSSDDSADADTNPNFYGTSAAAPNAAAVAADLMQAEPHATRAQILTAMEKSGIDITSIDSDVNAHSPGVTSGAGNDAWTGTGLIQADQALTNLAAMTVTGQLWFLTQGSTVNSRLQYVNNDGSTDTVLVDNSPTADLKTSFPQDVQVDWAAGVYFVVSNGGPTGSGASVLMGHINSSAAPVVVYTPPSTDDVINSLQVDPITHHLYVGKADAALTPTSTGILDFTYAPGASSTPLTLTPVATNNGFLVKASQQAAIPNDPTFGVPVMDPRAFALDHSTHTLFFVNETDGGAFTNEIYKVDETTGAVTKLLQQTQFPVTTDGSPYPNGYITGVEVDPSTGLVYFTTHSQHPSPDGSFNVATDHIYYIAETASGSTAATAVTLSGMPGSTANVFYPGEITIDLQNRMIYVGSEQTGNGTGADASSADDSIFVFQLSADGHSATYVRTITPSPGFTENADNISDMTFDDIPKLTGLAATTTHAVEQSAAVTLLTGLPTITDIDGDHLSSVTVQITGGTFSSNENSTADDHLSVIAGATAGTNITASYNAATETLTLSGYDTFAHYEAVMAAVQYSTTGDNPTNYGNNIARTITWTASDGALGIPDGQQNQGTTTINIDAVDDAPVNSVGGTLAATEDTAIHVTGVSISDVDADPLVATMTVTLSVSHGTLSATAFGSVVIGGSGTATMTLTGTQNDINGLIAGNHLTYTPAANYNGTDTLHIVTSDGGATGSGGPLSDTDDKAITVAAVNDPVTAAVPATATLNEDSSTAIPGMSISDVDTVLAPNGVYEVTISATHGVITLTTLTGLTFTAGDGTADGSMTFHGTLADINTALATASYAGNANYNGSDQVSLHVTDTFGGIVATGSGPATSDTENVAVTVNAVNDPVTAAVPGPITVNEDTPVAVTGVSISDVDAVLAPAGVYEVTVSATHGALTMTTLAGLTFTAGDGTADATMTFHGTLSAINAALATLGYTGDSNYNGSDTIDVHVTDTFGGIVATGSGAATSDDQSIAVTVTSVNDAPVTADNTVTTAEDNAYTFQTSDFPFSDPSDSPANSLMAVKIVSLPGAGTLTDNGVAVNVGDLISASDIASGKLVFTPAANANGSGYASFQFAVEDDGGTLNGGVDLSATHTLTVDVTAVNDAPVASVPGAQSGTQDTNLVFDGGHGNLISVSDVDDAGGNETVTLTVGHGTLTLSTEAGLTVTGDGTGNVQLTGTIADINTALNGLTYLGDLNYQSTDTLTVNVNDNGNTGTGGALFDQETVAITLAPNGFIDGNGSDNVLSGTPGDDFFRVQQGGNDTLSGLGGNDVFYFGAAYSSGDQVDGGPGSDIVAIQGNYPSLTLGTHSLDNVETLSILTHTDARFGGDSPTPYSY
ncbi:MAG TPA: Ig-like domain-containing protein, partial [Allosphingosinicella sp.]|nr:Ig-like domain-containing protein [Allosphingosinicella sp.]